MISPDRLPDIPQPIKPPERVFVEPMEATAAFIAAPMQQSIFAPLMSGVAGASSTLMKAASKGGAFGYDN